LGVRFAFTIYKALTLIAANPKAYPQKRSPYRESVIDKFPFIIIYELVEEDAIYILHIFHTSRNPKFKYRKR
jgi:plasmid stabilization system protein ParE